MTKQERIKELIRNSDYHQFHLLPDLILAIKEGADELFDGCIIEHISYHANEHKTLIDSLLAVINPELTESIRVLKSLSKLFEEVMKVIEDTEAGN